jgi:hypothetical protein
MMNGALSRSTVDGQSYSGNITTYEDLTSTNILAAISAMAQKSDDNDVTLFFFSGHGTQATATEAGTGIVGTDFTYISVTRLKTALDAIPGTVIVILDSCYSGMFISKGGVVTKSLTSFDPGSFNSLVGSAFTGVQAKGLTTSKYYVITACSKNEYSYNVSVSTGDSAGLATLFIAMGCGYDLLDTGDTTLLCDGAYYNHGTGAGNGDGIGSIEEVFNYADVNVDYMAAYMAAYWNDPSITQDMQYFATDTSFPVVGRD